MKHVVAALCLSLLSLDAAGQIASGALYGKITDHEGRPMPGVTITARGSGLDQSTVSGAAGEYRLIGLPPGPYSVSITLPGFETVSRSIVVELSRTTLVNVSLRPAVFDSITVSAPSYDTRRVAAGINVPHKELEEIPNRRDPYALLHNVPGVLLDRVNIAGNELAGPSAIAGHGTTRSQTAWILDGVTITDVGGFGGSPVFFDFDSFEEVDIRTSDIDPRVHSSGVQMNMITKRGTDEFRGSGRWFWTDRSLQSRPVIPAEARSFLAQTDHIDHIEDAGVEAGGPVLSRVWWWGAYGRQRTRSVAA